MFVRANGIRLWFDVEGSSTVPDGHAMREQPTILLLHGGPGSYDHTYFKPDFARLAANAQVVYLDVRGHGRSSVDDPSKWTIGECGNDVHAFCETLGIAKPIVFGHSLGAFIALAYATQFPLHPSALVLQSATAHFDVERVVEGFRLVGGNEVAAIADQFYRGDLSVAAEFRSRCRPCFGSWIPGEEERARMIVHPELAEHGLAEMQSFNLLHALDRIECPTLVCVGSRDPVTQVADARELVAGLRPGVGQLEIVEGAGHWTWKDAPDRYWPILEAFLASVAASAREEGAAR